MCMKIRSGYIPTDIVYIFSVTAKVAPRWSDVDQVEDELTYTSVTPAIVSEVGDEKAIKTAVGLASLWSKKWNSKHNQEEVVAQVQLLRKENQPIAGIKVIGLEDKGEGPRIYKVLTPDGFYFDISQDVLLETMKTKGIEPEGILGGQFVWAMVGTEPKLVRVDSELFVALLEAGERSILASIPKKKFKIGKIYESKLGERGIFLGYVTTETWKLEWPNGRSTFSNLYIKTDAKPTLVGKQCNKHMLWFDVPHWNLKGKKNDPTPGMFFMAMKNEAFSSHFKLRGTHAMVKEVGFVPVPEDAIEQIRQKALKAYRAKIHTLWLQKQANKPFMPKRLYDIEHAVAAAASTLLMRNIGAPRPTISEPEFLRVEQLLGKKID